MSRSRPSPFAAPVAEALVAIGEKLERQELVGSELDAALDGLLQLNAGALAEAERQIADLANLSRWRPAQPRLVGLFGRKVTDLEQMVRRPEIALLFLFHRDGFLREASLHRLEGGLPSAFAFAAVAQRLNDWVEPVRRAAHECAVRTFPLTDATVTAEAAVALLPRYHSWRRWTTERAIVTDTFDRGDVSKSLATIIRNGRTGPLASVLRASLRRPALDAHLDRIAEGALQPAVRALANEALIAGRARWPVGWEWKWIDKSMGLRRRVLAFDERTLTTAADRLSLISRSLTDRSALVRRVGLDALIRHRDGIVEARVLAEPLLCDRSAPVRERAEFLQR